MAFKSHACLDIENREKKAEKIEAALADFKNIKECRILDLGCGSGVMSSFFGKIAKEVWAVDIVDERVIFDGFNFQKVKDELLPFGDNSFDIVLSNFVIEHLSDKKKNLQEMRRVLKNGGVCYLAAPNKWVLREPHHHLFFLSWLPKKIADYYIKLSKRSATYDIEPLSFSGYCRLFKESGFSFDYYTSKIAKNPLKYKLKQNNIIKIISKFPLSVIDKLRFFLPTCIFILKK